jgi:hypothetical protein
MVFSPSSRGTLSYHMTIVPSDKVDALYDVMGKDRVTTGSLMKYKRLEGPFGPRDKVAARFDVLMALYVLSALGKAEMEKEGRNLVFIIPIDCIQSTYRPTT